MTLRNLGYAALVAATAAVIAIGSAGPSEAKSKKPAPPPQPVCMMTDYHPVCAVKGGMEQTYVNSCYAANDGATVVSEGACKAKPMHVKKHKKPMKPGKKKMKM